MPHGFDNHCEDENNNTFDEVIHSEENAICKAVRQGISLDGATLYLTLSPCPHCSKLIIQSGIKRVIYLEEYRISKSLEFLEKCGVVVIKL
jgi:dCMP deaminase